MRYWMMSGAAAAALMLAGPAGAQDGGANARIIDEGMNRSEVMLTSHELMDRIGPRLTNSPAMRRAEDWAMRKFAAYGLTNVHREGFDFGRGWEIVDSSVRMVSPRPLALTAIPIAWTPPTEGTLRAPIVVAPMNSPEHFAEYRGKLRGKIVLVSLPGEVAEAKEAAFERLDSAAIGKLDEYRQPRFDPQAIEQRAKRGHFARERDAFLASEGAVGWVRMSYRDGKLLHGEGYEHQVGATPKLPGVEIAAEDYRRLARLAKTGPAPTLEIRSDVRFTDNDPQGYNIIAEIPGRDPAAGYVLAGAHFDSWVAADGANDNGAGSVVVMEAARILRRLGVQPRRSIRFALWSGEEQGLFGSLSYVERHLAHRPYPLSQDGMLNYAKWNTAFPVTPRPGYNALKAYFNMDNGSGKLRGIYAEGNAAAVPLLREWLSPFTSMDASAVVAGPTGGTDHVFMQAVGVQGFQFIQDPLDYESTTHHSSVDTLDHMKAADLRQAAVVMAGMLLAAANSDKELPRPPVPTQPTPTDPFKYEYPQPR